MRKSRTSKNLSDAHVNAQVELGSIGLKNFQYCYQTYLLLAVKFPNRNM